MIHIGSKRVHEIVARFPKSTVLVVGDVMLDEFIWGKVNRISPEAPVPVVEVRSRSVMPGGAANVVNNILSLGAKASLIGVCGDDVQGRILKETLDKTGADTEGLIAASDRPTALKSRIIAHQQQVVRVDEESRNGHHPELLKKLLALIEKKVDQADIIVVEDYDKGVVDQALMSHAISLAKQKKKVITVDPKKGHFLNVKGASVLTPNKGEALAILGIEYEDRAPANEELPALLMEKWDCEAVLLTLGEEGMILGEKGKKPFHIPAVAREVYDVSGAGDTVIAAFTASLASGSTLKEAAEISNYAAGVVVGKVGTATVTAEELYREMKIELILEN